MSPAIEKNVPLPKKSEVRYPFLQMEVGDSFYAENLNSANASAQYHRKTKGWLFKTQRDPKQKSGRIWRVA